MIMIVLRITVNVPPLVLYCLQKGSEIKVRRVHLNPMFKCSACSFLFSSRDSLKTGKRQELALLHIVHSVNGLEIKFSRSIIHNFVRVHLFKDLSNIDKYLDSVLS